MKNSKNIILIIIFILIGVTSIFFFDWCEEIKFMNMREGTNKSNILPLIFGFIFLIVGGIGCIKNIFLLIKNNKNKIHKAKIYKIIFIISFFPYIFILLIALPCWNNGFKLFGPTTFGFDAFKNALGFFGLIFCYIPVLPTVFLYQVIYVIFKVVKKKKLSSELNQKSH